MILGRKNLEQEIISSQKKFSIDPIMKNIQLYPLSISSELVLKGI